MKLSLVQKKKNKYHVTHLFSMVESNIIVINSYWNLHQVIIFINSVENYRINANNEYFDQKFHCTLKFKNIQVNSTMLPHFTFRS